MPRENLTKSQVREANGLQLVRRLNRLHENSALRSEDAGVPVTDIREASAIVKELKRRLGKIWSVFFKGEGGERKSDEKTNL